MLRGLTRRLLDRYARNGQRYVDVSSRCPRIGAGLVRARHELNGLCAVDPRCVEVEPGCEPEATLARRADADSRGHARPGEIEVPPRRKARHAGLEARRITRREELLGIRPPAAWASHLGRDVEVNVQSTV